MNKALMQKANRVKVLHGKEDKRKEFIDRLIDRNGLVMEVGTQNIFRYNQESGIYCLCEKLDIYGLIYASFGRTSVSQKMFGELYTNIWAALFNMNQVKLDSCQDIINVKNGIYSLKDDKLYPHSPKYYSSVQLDIELPTTEDKSIDVDMVKHKYRGGQFDKFFSQFTNGDENAKELLLRFFGLMMSNIPGYSVKKGLFLVSKKGNTGKSLLKNLITDIVGRQHTMNLDLQQLEGRWGTGLCYKKRIVGSGDQSTTGIRELAVFKQMTGGDVLFAEKKGTDGFSYVFDGVFFACANQMPRFGGDKGDHLYDRFVIFEPQYSVPYEKQDRKLLDKLKNEKVYVAVLAIEALKRLINDDMILPDIEVTKKARMTYRRDNNSFATFCEECVIPLHRNRPRTFAVSCKTLFDIYRSWCQYNNYGASMPRKECIQMLKDAGLGRIMTYTGFNYFTQVTLKEESIDDYKKDNEAIRIMRDIPKNDNWGTDKKEIKLT